MGAVVLRDLPMVPTNCTLMPVCSNLLPSLGRMVTAPLTVSPSRYSRHFSRLFLSSLTSTVGRSSESWRTMSMSSGVEKEKSDMVEADCSFPELVDRASGMRLERNVQVVEVVELEMERGSGQDGLCRFSLPEFFYSPTNYNCSAATSLLLQLEKGIATRTGCPLQCSPSSSSIP